MMLKKKTRTTLELKIVTSLGNVIWKLLPKDLIIA